ncbi:bifunctional [glutamine synthetase] adenylyltransferase/[glutamine synthetase]-adenylyl-L-tyrosine phosphorylase [Rhabdothermincola salaria]|uniref:bifunctional [glutamine synthetase] adenylyltransferase/[glutamine synthetase]-adenylyl-L-tyrosine phosphorylase n=1 Tax=Rhabdothermincola salaria TaxID=2903142 RepID=UPI001E3F84FD|nr:bifunctional [glutamine synthetase] adenylyltransferase/[glutamine synthetase]-adenylyl-L-tyrosine phosphorylase [Rhabdothermincola salaria]
MTEAVPSDLVERAERSASPATVRVTLERLADDAPDVVAAAADHEGTAAALVAVLAASRSLTRVIEVRPQVALDVLADLDRRPPVDDGSLEALVDWRNLEFLRIAARDLTGLDRLEQVGAQLADLGRQALESACRLAEDADRDGPDGVTLAVVGMGKLGGSELNYSSDIDVMFVGEGTRTRLERRARAVMEIAGHCFRVDANLRPEGRDGPLVRSVESYEAYWERWAEPWEFQALLKARPAAGDATLGERWLEAAQERLWNRPSDADTLRSLRAMKQRAESEVAKKGLAARELKLGPGGIRDIEFTIQLLQLVHGHLDPQLRGPTTLSTLAEMASAGYVDSGDADDMATAYRLLRTTEHRVQLVDEQQVHALPSDRAALDHLARVMGRRDTTDGSAADQLLRDLRKARVGVRAIHERVYFRPLLEAFAQASPEDAALSPEAAAARLSAFGFLDAKRTQAAVKELTRGMNRSSRLMQQLLPLLLDWLSQSPDPDLGLLLVRNLLGHDRNNRTMAETFRDSPATAQALCTLAGTSRMLGDVLVRNPDLVARLDQPDRLETKPHDELVHSADRAVQWRGDVSERQETLQRWNRRHLFGVAARDVLGHADVHQVGADLTDLAAATLESALTALDPQVPFAVLGLGRFGGAELAYASDLDVIFVHDGRGAAGTDEAKRLATGLVRFVGGSTPAGRIYEVDAALRPEGKNGPLARSFGAFEPYWRDTAQTWERQAMTRARFAAGDRDLGERLLDLLDPFIWRGGLTADQMRDIRRMKARIEAERIPSGEDPEFHLKLGPGSLSDVEFTAQMLQLQYGVKATGTLDALRALRDADVLLPDDAEVLGEAYEFCERVRNRWFLVNSGPGDALPSRAEELVWLARSLDTTPGGLRDHYRRVTRRSRKVVERVFYGLPDGVA